MQTLAIVHFLNEKGKPILDIFKGTVFPEIDFLGFKGFEKAFDRGIIVRIAFTRHADLYATIRVMDDPFRGIAMCDSHLKRFQA